MIVRNARRMRLLPIPKPSELCGMCQKLGNDCFCHCHKEELLNGYHEDIYKRPD